MTVVMISHVSEFTKYLVIQFIVRGTQQFLNIVDDDIHKTANRNPARCRCQGRSRQPGARSAHTRQQGRSRWSRWPAMIIVIKRQNKHHASDSDDARSDLECRGGGLGEVVVAPRQFVAVLDGGPARLRVDCVRHVQRLHGVEWRR